MSVAGESEQAVVNEPMTIAAAPSAWAMMLTIRAKGGLKRMGEKEGR